MDRRNKTVMRRPEATRAHDTKEHLRGMIKLNVVSNTEDMGVWIGLKCLRIRYVPTCEYFNETSGSRKTWDIPYQQKDY